MLTEIARYSGAAIIVLAVIIYWTVRFVKAYKPNKVLDHKEPVKGWAEQAYSRAANVYVMTGNTEELERALEYIDVDGGFKYPAKWDHDLTDNISLTYYGWNSSKRSIIGEYGPEDYDHLCIDCGKSHTNPGSMCYPCIMQSEYTDQKTKAQILHNMSLNEYSELRKQLGIAK